jgi:alpha(1,3/1,4) fucosyltransferase
MKNQEIKYVFYVDSYQSSFFDKIKKLIGLKTLSHSFSNEHDSGIRSALKKSLEVHNIKFINHLYADESTQPDVILHFDLDLNFKSMLNEKWPMSKHILCLQECEVIHENNWNLESHKLFDTVLTWNTNLVTLGLNYKHIYTIQGFSSDVDLSNNMGLDKKKKLVSLVSSNKVSFHPKELYSERVNCIKWFENFHRDDLDLFGYGWNLLPSGHKFYVKLIKNISFLSRAISTKYSVYKGSVPRKKDALEPYKFNIAFENANSISGYITEKIFDSFVSGTIPVYLGAPNIKDFIPSECFIDMNKFNDYEELYEYMTSMSDEDYLGYQKRIKFFLRSNAGKNFTNENYHRIVHDSIIEYIN